MKKYNTIYLEGKRTSKRMNKWVRGRKREYYINIGTMYLKTVNVLILYMCLKATVKKFAQHTQ